MDHSLETCNLFTFIQLTDVFSFGEVSNLAFILANDVLFSFFWSFSSSSSELESEDVSDFFFPSIFFNISKFVFFLNNFNFWDFETDC